MRIAKVTGFAALAVLCSAAAVWAQCQGACEGAKKAECKPVSFSVPVKGESNDAVIAGLSALPAVGKADVANGTVAVTMKKRTAIKLSELEAALKSAKGEVVRKDLRLTGNLVLSVTGMTCADCVEKLEEAFSTIEGIGEIRVGDPKAGAVKATLKDVSYETLGGAVKDAGFSLADVTWTACCGKCEDGGDCCGRCEEGGDCCGDGK